MTGRQNFIGRYITKHQLYVLKGTALFIIITLAIHIAWRVWARQFNYAPVSDFLYTVMEAMAVEVYRESVWIIKGLYDVVTVDETMHMYFPNQSIMYINESCSGLKQILQFALLMMLFPGPWKKKLWFIPLGAVILHITNILRVVGLAIVMNHWPWNWEFSHDYIFRPVFYVVIFGLWLVWEERIRSGTGFRVQGTG